MNCLSCKKKSCRSASSCGMEGFPRGELQAEYLRPGNQSLVQSAADLVDGGLAGTLSRVEELIRFIQSMGYRRPALAYCYGMEAQAVKLAYLFRDRGTDLKGVSCTAGSHRQEELNQQSTLPGVSCNPLSQARQMNEDGVDLAILFGLCLGHDILFQRHFEGDCTTLVVKDRLYHHSPLKALE